MVLIRTWQWVNRRVGMLTWAAAASEDMTYACTRATLSGGFVCATQSNAHTSKARTVRSVLVLSPFFFCVGSPTGVSEEGWHREAVITQVGTFSPLLLHRPHHCSTAHAALCHRPSHPPVPSCMRAVANTRRAHTRQASWLCTRPPTHSLTHSLSLHHQHPHFVVTVAPGGATEAACSP
jgi:hypothetical protein